MMKKIMVTDQDPDLNRNVDCPEDKLTSTITLNGCLILSY